MKSDLGFQLTGVRNVGAILNVDIANNKPPTDAQIDDLLADIRATGSGRTMLLMHQRVQNWLGRLFKKDRVQMRPEDNNITRKVLAWDGVPILSSYNLYDGTEGRVILS